MSLPYPHDRARARQDEGQQPYKDAREAMAEKEALLDGQARALGPEAEVDAEAGDVDRIEAEAVERLREVGDEVARADREGGEPTSAE